MTLASCRRLWLLLLPFVLVGCPPGRGDRLGEDADEYIAGVQYRDPTAVIKRTAAFRDALQASAREEWPVLREEFLSRARERMEAFDEVKASGRLPMEADGIDLIQGLAIGKGIYYRFDEIRLEEEERRAVGIMEVTPDYGEHRLRGLPAGTRIYLMGEPFGTLQGIELGEVPEEQTVRVVQTVRLEWSFRWFEAEDVYPDGWAVESVRPVPGSAVMVDLRGIF